MMTWLSRCTLDVIGKVGFNYDLHALEGKESEISGMLKVVLEPKNLGVVELVIASLIAKFPIILKIPMKKAQAMNRGIKHMESEGREMLDLRRAWNDAGELDEKTDLMSLLVKANIKESNKKDKLYDDEMFGQVSTFVSIVILC